MGFVSVLKDLQDTKDQIGPSDTQNLVFKRFDSSFQPAACNVELISQNIGHAFTVGHATNGIIGTALGVDGSQITIGVGGLGSSSVVRAAGGNTGTFIEMLRNNKWVDTSNTTATVDTTNFRIDF